MRTHQVFTRVFFSAFMLLATKSSYASGNFSADEVRSLFSGNTVEGGRVEGRSQGSQSSYSEPFIYYFADDGKLYSVRGKTRNSGSWRVNNKGYLCIDWKGTKGKCAPIYKDGDYYKQDMKNKIGKIKWTNTYTTFAEGKAEILQDR
jgi:hypothetical protein